MVKDVVTVGGGMSPCHELDLDDLRLSTPLPVLTICPPCLQGELFQRCSLESNVFLVTIWIGTVTEPVAVSLSTFKILVGRYGGLLVLWLPATKPSM